ncbi:metal-dependent hydrolase [Halosimplex amylolyticum]|uniref:metal-dependent hydrolase n=1 Tax=Halosimplex amylolyticum TaxID=3396616 RepID=UPI003F545A63
MWPWEHLALGYVAFSLVWRASRRERDGRAAVAVGVGTQIPDIVDKGLAWHLDVLPAARSLAHSALVAVPVSAVVLAVAARKRRPDLGFAFVIGYLTHLFGDALPRLVDGYYHSVGFLLWPILPASPDQGMGTVVGRFRELAASPETYFAAGSYRTVFVLLMVALWIADGVPGPADIGRYLWRSSQFRGND